MSISLNRSPLPVCAGALLAGQALAGLRCPVDGSVQLAVGVGALLALCARRVRAAIAAALVVLGFHQVEERMREPRDPAHIVARAPGTARVRARVVERGDGESGRLRLRLDVDAVRRGDVWEKASGLVQLTVAEPRRAWLTGARVEAILALRRPRNFGNPGEFDYEAYLARRRIYVTSFAVDDDEIHATEVPAASWISAWRERVRAALARVTSPSREILAALILGEMGSLPRAVRDDFSAVGVSHVLSISGLHVALVAGSAFAALRWLLSRSRWLLLRARVPLIAAALSLVPVFLYAELAQAGVATGRSLVMLGTLVSGVLVERRSDLRVNLAAAAIAVSLYWPGSVLDISFQLSFVSVLVLVMAMERYWRWWSRHREARLLHLRGRLYAWLGWLAAALTVNASALVATAPLTAFHFHQVPLLALLANPLVVPLLGHAAVALGLLGAFGALFSDSAASLLLAAAAFAVSVGTRVTAALAALPGAGDRVVAPSLLELALIYAILAAVLFASGWLRRIGVGLLLSLLLVDVGWQAHARWNGRVLRATFLAVGQGDCTVLELPGGAVIVVDGGGLYGMDTGERVVGPYLWRQKIARLDAIVLTHPQFDHYGGLVYLARHFAPREFWHSGAKSDSASYAALRAALREAGTRDVVVGAGDERWIGGCAIEVLWPPRPPPTPPLSKNDGSVVLRVECGDSSVLLPGDLERGGEAALLRRGGPLRSDILKVGHHGSRTSTTPAFLDAVRPRAAVISAGYRNRFGFPDEGVRRRLAVEAEVRRTDVDGAVVAEGSFDGEMSLVSAVSPGAPAARRHGRAQRGRSDPEAGEPPARREERSIDPLHSR